MKGKTFQESVRKIRIMDALLRSGRAGFLALGLFFGILVASCGGGSLPPSAPSPSPQVVSTPDTSPQDVITPDTSPQDVSTQDTSTPDTSTQDAPPQDVRPGTEEFGLTKEGLVRSIEAVESLIAQCMNDAGFEYIAVDYNTVRKGSPISRFPE